MNIAFWNTGRRNLDSLIAGLVADTKTNVLVLAEHTGDDTSLLRMLARSSLNYSCLPNIGCTRIKVFTDLEPSCFTHKRESDRYTIREFSRKGDESILLGLVHLPSKLHTSPDDQLQEAKYFRDEIELAERDVNHRNTIILGDFNMDPFEPGMISAAALHSLPCLHTALSGARTIRGRSHSFFYNPTWNLFGDVDGTPGTYYYSSSSHITFFWHLLDQVILRPTIAKRFDKKSLRIVTNVGQTSLLDNNGRPGASDHLPIVFSMNLSHEQTYEKSLA